MSAGAKRFQVTIQRRADAQSQDGLEHSYTNVGDDMASIRALSGRELFAAQQVQAEVTTEVRMRWRPDVDETCRLLYFPDPDASPLEPEVYDIAVPMPDSKTGRRELVLLCVRRRAEGWRSGPA